MKEKTESRIYLERVEKELHKYKEAEKSPKDYNEVQIMQEVPRLVCDKAQKACTFRNADLAKKLHKVLPFENSVQCDRVMMAVDYDFDHAALAIQDIFNKERQEQFTLGSIHGANTFYDMESINQVKNYKGDAVDKLSFGLIDWLNALWGGTYLTSVQKTPLVIQESAGRFDIWQKIHEAIEEVAANAMQDKGINL